MLVQPGFLLCQLAYELDKTGYLAGWMHTRSLAPPLRTWLDGTTLNLASNPHRRWHHPQFGLLSYRWCGLETKLRVVPSSRVRRGSWCVLEAKLRVVPFSRVRRGSWCGLEAKLKVVPSSRGRRGSAKLRVVPSSPRKPLKNAYKLLTRPKTIK